MSQEMEKRLKYSDWKELYTDNEEGVYSWLRTTSDGLLSMYAIYEIDGTVIELLKILSNDPKYKKIYDPSFFSREYLQRIDEHTWMTYLRVKKVAIVSGRDWILIYHWNVTEDGIVYLTGFSVDREDIVPQ
jgi:hypothetical protein